MIVWLLALGLSDCLVAGVRVSDCLVAGLSDCLVAGVRVK